MIVIGMRLDCFVTQSDGEGMVLFKTGFPIKSGMTKCA